MEIEETVPSQTLDIDGVVMGGDIYIVQLRPQLGLTERNKP